LRQARQRIVKTVLEGVYVCAHLLEPFIPHTGAAIFDQLGCPQRKIIELSTEYDNLAVGVQFSTTISAILLL
jgi:methionyl-tRNA synthetase